MKKSKEPIVVYVYEDTDNNDVQVFSTFEKADAYMRERWGHDPDWTDWCDWHDGGSRRSDNNCDYITVHKAEVK